MIKCYNCGNEFQRRNSLDGTVYINVYGTRCPKCNYLIKPDEEPEIIQEGKKNVEKLRQRYKYKIIEIINKIKGK